MAFEVILPKLGQTMTEGTIIKWHVQEGDPVTQGDILFEVESDKATLEVEATNTGILRKILVPAGRKVPILTTVAIIGSADEDISQYERETPSSAEERTKAAVSGQPTAEAPPVTMERAGGRIVASPRARRLAKEKGVDLSQIQGSGPNGRIVEKDVLAYLEAQPRVTPLARKIAEEAGLDLSTVPGTGPGGRVTREDVDRAIAQRKAVVRPFAPEVVPMTGLRAIIAERMAASHQTTARVTLTTHVDATEFVALRTKLRDAYREQLGFSIGYNDLLIRIVGKTLREFPYMNVQLAGDEIHQMQGVNVGLAVDTERGLLVPVIRDADRKGVVEIAKEVRELVERARAGKSLPDDLTGGTFTVTNLGTYDIDAFTPIINLPECAILGVGRIMTQPYVVGDRVVPRQVVWLSLTFDHRLVDGAPAARFLQRVKQYIETPYLLLA